MAQPIKKYSQMKGESTQAIKKCKVSSETDELSSTSIVKFVKLSEHAYTPTKGSTLSAGHDLYSAYEYFIAPGDRCLIPSDISIELPAGCYGRIAPRSGLAMRHCLHTLGGVIDGDFRGNIQIILINLGTRVYHVKKGDRIAQLICEKIHYPRFVEVRDLSYSQRNRSGFGSTGFN